MLFRSRRNLLFHLTLHFHFYFDACVSLHSFELLWNIPLKKYASINLWLSCGLQNPSVWNFSKLQTSLPPTFLGMSPCAHMWMALGGTPGCRIDGYCQVVLQGGMLVPSPHTTPEGYEAPTFHIFANSRPCEPWASLPIGWVCIGFSLVLSERKKIFTTLLGSFG